MRDAAAAPGTRPLPLLEPETRFFWEAGAQGRLLIQRCAACGTYHHPPKLRCGACGGGDLAPAPVSGEARVATWTVNHERWLPAMEVPFVFAAVELDEQAELYVFTNILAPADAITPGMRVRVRFEQHADVWLPMFVPAGAEA